MKLVMLFGDAAVGKMTVGQELAKITDLTLFHNHMTIEPVLEIFGYYNKTVISKWRNIVFEEFAKSNNYGLIFTYMWAFNRKEEWTFVKKIVRIFEKQNADIYYVELDAPQEVRLQRNVTENRLKCKPSKRNIELSNLRLLDDDEEDRYISYPNEIKFENFLRIENENISAVEAAKIIKEKFKL